MKKLWFDAFAVLLFVLGTFGNVWVEEKRNGYSIVYTPLDSINIEDYDDYFKKGIGEVVDFFNTPYKNSFSIYIHPNRESLDSTWQKDWGMPDFKSQCWMVASGVSEKLDIISPKTWDSLSCEHHYADTIGTYQLIKHELVHVFHGQRNKSPDFGITNGIDWLVEGMATYASGQCNSKRISEVKKIISRKEYPQQLNEFWKGNSKYGLSGTMVMYIDDEFGRTKLLDLLRYNYLMDVLNELEIREEELIGNWKHFVEQL